uniref:Uncharacterized protein n=1 Tax=Rhodosorus marinus TaxID=101924 RepID=A0A7S2ZBF1_9RHOD|mmetsp:Transcript_11893/g.49661  ORF Transcript_11893/g.49661 Transcript_11893/m.49661 type:complete len:118 (+) Transcript_11893:553-906(+)
MLCIHLCRDTGQAFEKALVKRPIKKKPTALALLCLFLYFFGSSVFSISSSETTTKKQKRKPRQKRREEEPTARAGRNPYGEELVTISVRSAQWKETRDVDRKNLVVALGPGPEHFRR